jgi:hypothetical protein
MHKYSKDTTQYKDVPNDAQVLTTLDKYDSNETENLGMWLAHLSMPQMCASWVSEDAFNSLLERYKIDITSYVKDDERITTSIKDEVRSELFYLINKDKYKKRNLIKALRNKFPDVNSGVICRMIKKYLSLRVLEIDRTYKTKPFVIKGKYYIN